MHYGEKEDFMKRNRRNMGIYSVSLILVGMLLVGMPFVATAADTIKIGALGSASGPWESIHRLFYNGFKFAMDEQNAKGGLLGKKIEAIVEDNEFKGDVATRKAKKLILEDKVNIICTSNASPCAVALNKVATDYKILHINHGGLSTEIQGREFSRYSFRVAPSEYNHWAALALFMAKKPYRRFYLLGMDFLFSHSAADAFKAQIKIHLPDATVVGEDYHPPGAKDFGPYITKIIAAKADAVLVTSVPPYFAYIIKQARAMGLKAPFPFLTNIVEPHPMNELKEDGVSIYATHGYSLRVKTPENQEMIKRYREMHKDDKDFQTWWPVGNLATGILGWKMTFAAIEKAGSLDPEKVIEAFEGFQYNTPVGLWTMRKCDHQVIVPMYGLVMESQNPYFDGSIRPEIKFPWVGPNIEMFPAEKVNIAATPDYNPRCR
jgi:branched-chain amino acid transport system substrate-binding protein